MRFATFARLRAYGRVLLAGLFVLLLLGCTRRPGPTRAMPSPTPLPWTPRASSHPTTASPTTANAITPTARPSPTPSGPEAFAAANAQRLAARTVIPFDAVAFVQRLREHAVPWATPTPPPRAALGVRQSFYVLDPATNHARQITAQLIAQTDHVAIWLDTAHSPNFQAASRLAEVFSTHIYPTTRQIFGSEPNPGIDGDPRVYILFTPVLGNHLGGYFASWDLLPNVVRPTSNMHEMFVVNAALAMDQPQTWHLLAHEFQHMIHAAHDPTETAWLNEGLSELAVWVNGYGPSGWVGAYLQNPDRPLLHWPDPQYESTGPYYGGNFLLALYLYEQMGPRFIHDMVQEPRDGLAGLAAVLRAHGATREPEDLLLDWAIALWWDDPDLADGRFGFSNYDLPQPPASEPLPCPGDYQGTVAPFGVDYLELPCAGSWRIRLEAEPYARLWPVEPASGAFAMWSGYGNNALATLTRMFDLRGLAPGTRVTLRYRTWFDIERHYDYGYVLLSGDGQHWHIARTRYGTGENPTGANFGWGYTGASLGWLDDAIDLSDYAGQQVWVQFAYVTDTAVNRTGWLVDDVRIDALGYHEDFEHGDGGWRAQGFLRLTNRVPRRYRAALLIEGPQGRQVLPLSMQQTGAELTVAIPAGGRAVLVFMDVTRAVTEPARYQVHVLPVTSPPGPGATPARP